MNKFKMFFHICDWDYYYEGTPENHSPGAYKRVCSKCGRIQTKW